MLARRLKILVATAGAIIVLLAVAIYVGSSRVDYDLTRSTVARQQLESYLKLSEIIYRHFHLEADALLSGAPESDMEASRTRLNEALATLKAVTKQEFIFIENKEEKLEAEEFERNVRLEREVQDAQREVQRIRRLLEQGEESEAKRALSVLLYERIDGTIRTAIAAAIEDEAGEMVEAEKEARVLLGGLNVVANITALAALGATGVLFFLFTKRVGQPVTRLVEGINRLANGVSGHRLVVNGSNELAEVADNFNAMAAKIEQREAELQSSRAELETQVEERTKELNVANSALHRTDQLRQRFLADISHELRTPITVIQGEAEVALRGNVKVVEEYKRALKHIEGSANQLGRLVSDLLFMARTSAGEAYINRQAVELKTLLEDVREDAEVLAKNKDIKIALRRLEGDATVLGDRQKLCQLFLILIENAIRYSDSKVRITLDVTRSGDLVRTRVCDNGSGMSATEVENAFDRFYRGDGAQQSFSEGSGLGLPIAKSIVVAHKGEIFIESASGQGTTITIDLPSAQKIRPAA